MEDEEEFEYITGTQEENEHYVAVWTPNGFVAMTRSQAEAFHERQKQESGVTELQYRVSELEKSRDRMQKTLKAVELQLAAMRTSHR